MANTDPATISSTPVTRRSFVAAASALGAAAASPRRSSALEAVFSDGDAKKTGSLSSLFASSGQPPAEPAHGLASLRPTLLTDLDPDPQVEASAPDHVAADDLSNVVNLADMYLADQQLDLLRRNGFFVMLDGANEFFDVYETNRYDLTPSLVTVDSMMHTYHLYFAHLMKNVERDHLVRLLQDMSAALLEESTAQLDALRGTEWESAAARNAAFFAVGARCLGLYAPVPDDAAPLVEAETAAIEWAGGIEYSELLGYSEDYSQYIVRGYYEGDASLEGFFRAMMWYGRRNFTQDDEDLDRSALLMTLALSAREEALADWSTIYVTTSFFAGASDDNGYYEYRPLVDQSFGVSAGVADLPGNDSAWQMFHALTGETPAPKIGSIPVPDTGTQDDHLAQGKGFRLMGQRFSLDEAIFQRLCYNKVGEDPYGDKRLLPDALDIPAAFGSDEALSILDERGNTLFAGYLEGMEEVRGGIAGAAMNVWTASLYSQWLRTLQPLLDEKGEGYPLFMRNAAWSRKDLLTFLGSYTELKHDTVLYSKQMMAEAGGYIEERDDRGYVEPETLVYARLAALTGATSRGLAGMGLLGEDDAYNLGLLADLAHSLQTISEKELRDETLTDDEYELIRSFGVQLEHFWQEVYKDQVPEGEYFRSQQFPAAVITDIATDPNGLVLQVGTGRVGRLSAIVPVDGTLRVAQGPVYTFYQFEQPIDQRLTDTQWRRMLGIELAEDGGYLQQSEDLRADDWVYSFAMSWRDLYQ